MFVKQGTNKSNTWDKIDVSKNLFITSSVGLRHPTIKNWECSPNYKISVLVETFPILHRCFQRADRCIYSARTQRKHKIFEILSTATTRPVRSEHAEQQFPSLISIINNSKNVNTLSALKYDRLFDTTSNLHSEIFKARRIRIVTVTMR